MEYNVERISPAHYKDMQFLFKHCFKRSVNLDFFKRKFDTARFGADHIGYFAYTKGGFPASSFSIYPNRIGYCNTSHLAAIAGDAMTHTEHRSKGLFHSLGTKTIQLGKDSGIRFIYVFPNEHSLSGSIKIGFQYADEKMRTYRIKVNTLPLAKLCRKSSFTNSIYKQYARFILKFTKSDATQFNNSLLSETTAGVLHDADFFSYKSYSQNAIVKMDKHNVWLKVDGELKIGDVEKHEGMDPVRLMKKLKRLSFFLGCNEIQTTVCEESLLHQLMRPHFKNAASFMVGRIDCGLDFPKETVKFTMADFDTF